MLAKALSHINSSKEAASLLREIALVLLIAIGKVHYAQERVLAGKLANALGYGGQAFVAALLGRSPEFIRKGQQEAASGLAEAPKTCQRGRKAPLSYTQGWKKTLEISCKAKACAIPSSRTIGSIQA